MTEDIDEKCHVCGHLIQEIDGFGDFCQVTSDCRPWRAGGRLAFCGNCGVVQKRVNEIWLNDCEEIYRSYVIYNQGGGIEQQVFDQNTGAAASRSTRLVQKLLEHIILPDQGRLLDIGCGNGAFLSAFGAVQPGWRLTGTEFSDTNRHVIEALPGVEHFHVGDIANLAGGFDVAVMIHCLEHIPAPTEFLRKVATKLTANGLLIVEVPNYAANPFDLLIADHGTHYSILTLGNVVTNSGFDVELLSDSVIPKELTLVACRGDQMSDVAKFSENPKPDAVLGAVAWLHELLELAMKASGPVGIFGTSISGTWLASQLSSKVAFFLDEDPNRIGKHHMGLPILAPIHAPVEAATILPFPTPIARSIAVRLNHMKFILPE